MLKKLSDIVHERKTNDFTICVAGDKYPNVRVLSVHDRKTDYYLPIRSFSTVASYEKFLVESVIMRNSLDEKTSSKVKTIYRKTCAYLRKMSVASLFVCTFLLSACSSISSSSGTYELDTSKGTYRCQYQSGSFINCQRLEKELNK